MKERRKVMFVKLKGNVLHGGSMWRSNRKGKKKIVTWRTQSKSSASTSHLICYDTTKDSTIFA